MSRPLQEKTRIIKLTRMKKEESIKFTVPSDKIDSLIIELSREFLKSNIEKKIIDTVSEELIKSLKESDGIQSCKTKKFYDFLHKECDNMIKLYFQRYIIGVILKKKTPIEEEIKLTLEEKMKRANT